VKDYLVHAAVRLSCNYADLPFDAGKQEKTAQIVTERVSAALEKTGDAYAYLLPSGLSERKKNFLLDRRLLHADTVHSPYSVAYLRMDENACVQTALADHLSIATFSEEGDVQSCLKTAKHIRSLLSDESALAYDAEFGYLTAHPCDAGTGMRATLLMNLPAIYAKHELLGMIRSHEMKQCIIRSAGGDILLGRCGVYCIENRVSLGMRTAEIAEQLLNSANALVEKERELRAAAMNGKDMALNDFVWRAYGITTCAQMITQREALKLWSELTMGVSIGAYALDDKVLTGMWEAACGTITLNNVQTQEEANVARAQFIRSLF